MSRIRDPILRYGCALISIVIAVGIRLLLDPLFGFQFPFATVFLAVLFTAWYGGFRPALTAVLLGALASDFFLLPPRGQLALLSLDQKIGMAIYLATGMGIALLGGAMQAARQRAEAQANAARDQAELIDQTHDPILVWEWDGVITFWNKGAERLYGFSSEEAIGRVSRDLLRTGTAGGAAVFLRALESVGEWEGELRHTARDGRAIDVESRMVLAQQHNRRYVIEANSDITARKAAEAALRTANESLEERVQSRTAELDRLNQSLQASEERYRLLIEGVRAYAIFMLDTAAKVVTWNAGAQHHTGYRAEEIIGRHVACFYSSEDIAGHVPERDLQAAITTGRSEQEGWRIRKDGSPFWASSVVTSLPGQGFALLMRDKTTDKHVEGLLQASEAKFRSYIESAPVAIMMMDPAGRFADCNPAASTLLGRTVSNLVGRPLLSVFLDEDHAELLRAFEGLKSGGVIEGEYLMRHWGGASFWAGMRAVRLQDGMLLAYCTDITARKQNEATLRMERDWFANIVATVPVVICSFRRRTDGSIHFPYANPRLEDIYGLRPEDLAKDATPIFTRIHPDDADRVRDTIEESERSMSAWRCVFRVRNPTRGDVWVEGHSVPILERNGDMLWQGYVADITERKATEEALQTTETSLQLMIEGVTDHAIFMLDPTGKILTWNQGAERIDGYTTEEIIGQDFSCLFTPPAIAAGKPQQELAQAAAEGKAEVDGWRVRKNGSRFWANGTVAALYDQHRQVRGFAKVTRDLTAKRRNDEMLRSVLDHTLDAIICIDEQGIISAINRAGETMFGWSEPEVIGNNVKMLMPAPYHAEHDAYLGNYLRTGEARIIGLGREVRGLRKSGSTFPADLAVTEFDLDNQRFFVGIVRDISERKALETQLHQSQKMEAFGQLAGGVAHDFNNLLTVISGYSDILLTVLPPDDLNRQMIEEIRRAGDRATSLTRQLLAFTRQQVLEPRVVDLNAILRDIESLLRRLIGEDVQFTSVLRADLSPVTVDPGQIEQVLLNLAVNARDAMPRGGKLTIETSNVELLGDYARLHPESRPGRFVMLAISDTGSGMTAEVKGRIFEPFFTTKGGKGTGLGLAVVQGVVKQSGGTIEVYSEVGIGTTFKIYLPASPGERVTPLEPALQRLPRGGETILLVEDEAAVRHLTLVALQGVGYKVLTASGGRAALRVMAAHPREVDLLVTDVVMPEMSGRQLAETLQAQHPTLKVLYLSGYTDDAVVRHGVLQANVAFLQKPFSPASLARKVRDVLDGQ